MFEGSGFQQTYEVAAKRPADLKKGQSYFGFDCSGCGKRFAVWGDSSAGAQPFSSKRPCIFKVACPHCGASRLYRTDQVKGFRA
jgi:predicted RNA-binding Zn-ribbon protein involved in translation (DUF1610 family)